MRVTLVTGLQARGGRAVVRCLELHAAKGREQRGGVAREDQEHDRGRRDGAGGGGGVVRSRRENVVQHDQERDNAERQECGLQKTGVVVIVELTLEAYERERVQVGKAGDLAQCSAVVGGPPDAECIHQKAQNLARGDEPV